MEKITFVIPSKNNLRYLKWAIPSIRKNAYRDDHDIIVFVDKDEDGSISWLEENKHKYDFRLLINPELNETLYGIGKAYDKCIMESKTDVVCIFHADMYLCKDADKYMYDRLTENSVVCATRIEPPLHPEGKEKIVKHFGMWPEKDVEEGFKEDELNDYVAQLIAENSGKTTNGCFAPWMIHKSNMLKLGGHDLRLKSAREDSDIFNRMVLMGLDLVQTWEGYVYHLTCRGGQFEHGKLTQDHSQKSEDWQKLMAESTREYVRKWGTVVRHDELLYPNILPKYNMSLTLLNAPPEILYELLFDLEPFFDTIYIDNDEIRELFIKDFSTGTQYDLSKRIKLVKDNKHDHNFVLKLDCKNFKSKDEVVQNMNFLKNMPEILQNNDLEVGVEFKIFYISIFVNDIIDNSYELINNEEYSIMN